MVFGKKKPSEALKQGSETTAARGAEHGKISAAKDPVCGTAVDTAKEGVLTVKFFDTPLYFCSLKCLGEFEKDPYKYGKKKRK